MMLKSVGAIMVMVAFLLVCARGGGAAQTADIISQLEGLDLDGVKQVIGSMVAKMRGLEIENAVLQSKTNAIEAELRNKTLVEEELRGEISWLKRDKHEHRKTQTRRVQDSDVVGDAQVVHIFKRSVPTTHLFGRVDGSNGQHRLLGESSPANCSSAEISRQISAINVECCDEPGEDCSNGKVHHCNAGCGALIMPLWNSCQAQLGSAAKVLQDAVALCPPSDVSFTSTSANMFMATCPSGEPADDCIPLCEEETHGYLLLLNINGEDAKLTCELHHDGYSWVGGASDGGYIGAVFEEFFSSIIAAAAGTYIVTITKNQAVHTDVTIEPGQVVAINGDRSLPQQPTWGSGGLTVAETGSLSLSYMQIAGNIITTAGATHLSLDTCLLTLTDAIVLQPDLSLTMKSTTMTSTETMLLRDGMHATLIGMDAQFGGNPSWVVTKSGETATGQVCDADGTNCVEDLCAVVDCNGGDTGGLNPGGTGCVSPQGTCDCGDPKGSGYSGERCEIHTCCSNGGSLCCKHPDPGADCTSSSCFGNRYHCCLHCSGEHVGWCNNHYPGYDDSCDRTC